MLSKAGGILRIKAAVVFVMIGLLCICVSGIIRGRDEGAGVTFPVLSDMLLDISNPEFVLKNPSENRGRYILRYEFADAATGSVFFSTNWLEGGRQYHYRLDDLRDSVDCRVHIYAKDAGTYEDVSGVNISIKIGVENYEA